MLPPTTVVATTVSFLVLSKSCHIVPTGLYGFRETLILFLAPFYKVLEKKHNHYDFQFHFVVSPLVDIYRYLMMISEKIIADRRSNFQILMEVSKILFLESC